MRYEKLSDADFIDLYVHDAEIEPMKFDYYNEVFEINLKCYTIEKDGKDSKKPTQNISLRFEDVQYFEMTTNMPWGGGVYADMTEIIKDSPLLSRLEDFDGNKNEYRQYQFLFNTGDKLNIVARSVSKSIL
jgi:hypothetical protein